MTLPINRQPVVRPGNKITSFGFPFHGLVESGVLTLPSPASPPTKTFPEFETAYFDGSSTVWYRGYNVTNTTRVQRPGWTVPARSAEELAIDAAKGHTWKPYMTYVGKDRRLGGTDNIQIGNDRWIYTDGDGISFIIKFSQTHIDSDSTSFTFRIVEMKLTLEPEVVQVISGVVLNTLSFFGVGGSGFSGSAVKDRTPTGDRVLLMPYNLSGSPGIFFNGGLWSTPRFEAVVSGNGIGNISITVNDDPSDEIEAATGGDAIRDFCYDDTGTRLALVETTTAGVTDISNEHPIGSNHFVNFTTFETIEIDYYGYLTVTITREFEHSWVLATSTETVVAKVNGATVDSDSAVNGGPPYYDGDTGTVVGGSNTSTAINITGAWQGLGGADSEYFIRSAFGYEGTSGTPTSGVVISDTWVNKKTGATLSGPGGWNGDNSVGGGNVPGVFEFIAYDPETATTDFVVFALNDFPVWPAALDLNYYV